MGGRLVALLEILAFGDAIEVDRLAHADVVESLLGAVWMRNESTPPAGDMGSDPVVRNFKWKMREIS